MKEEVKKESLLILVFLALLLLAFQPARAPDFLLHKLILTFNSPLVSQGSTFPYLHLNDALV